MPQTPAPPARADPVIHESRALDALLQQLQAGRKYSILDLGQACGQNLDFWSQFPVKIYLPDFWRSLAPFSPIQPDEEGVEESLFERLLPYGSDCVFDIILAWDLFNYLERDRLERLIRHLKSFCRPGTCLFLLLSSLKQIPSEPTDFRILDREHLSYGNPAAGTRSWSNHQPRELMALMTGFEVLASFFLRHGMHEFLFVHR